ncbi:GntR family transcriptional regulator [Veronia nyctiphanis]|uniref:GntR family transcriptional regulator n=1 Tax=Veronia nyctiphanis TaxID=1278244 RepID=A0A4Q0YSX7_9GAMM|nr:S1-like domain-containing RNA-binding protein [Veronia nyctiphanis]RXJ74286.1 GntR family transcriptional regulator [Veronia nyctiphanis]
MIKIGQRNTLPVVKEVDFGVFLDGGDEYGNILLPKRYVPKGTQLDDELDVFIYFDSEDDVIATTEEPLAQVGQFALLRCVNTNRVGAFLNWGLPKDLLVPFSEQRIKMQEGREYLVFLYLDNASGRIVGSTKFNKFLDKMPASYKQGEQVDLVVAESTDLGFKCAVNGQHWGLLYRAETFGKLFIGKKLKGFIRNLRDDGKIDLSLQKAGKGKVDDLSDKILTALDKKGGFLPVTDKSSPDQIFSLFRTSKATFKRTIGALYKQRKIRIENDGIYLVK